jgi:transcriptional regulator with XRE-family HTH domain
MPDRFHGLLLTFRGRTQLTQRQLAARAAVSIRSIQGWEAGLSYPSAQRLQELIAVLVEAGGLRAGHEREEAHNLWAAVVHEAARNHKPFDHNWFASVLADRAGAALPGEDLATEAAPQATVETPRAVVDQPGAVVQQPSGRFDGTVRLWAASDGAHLGTLRSDRPYERMDITRVTGLTAAQHAALLALGAVERED